MSNGVLEGLPLHHIFVFQLKPFPYENSKHQKMATFWKLISVVMLKRLWYAHNFMGIYQKKPMIFD